MVVKMVYCINFPYFDLLNLISISSDWKLKHYPYFYINLFGLSIVFQLHLGLHILFTNEHVSTLLSVSQPFSLLNDLI